MSSYCRHHPHLHGELVQLVVAVPHPEPGQQRGDHLPAGRGRRHHDRLVRQVRPQTRGVHADTRGLAPAAAACRAQRLVSEVRGLAARVAAGVRGAEGVEADTAGGLSVQLAAVPRLSVHLPPLEAAHEAGVRVEGEAGVPQRPPRRAFILNTQKHWSK